MKYFYLIIAVSILVACDNASDPESVQKNKEDFKESPVKDDVAFIGEIGQGNLLEIHLAQLAQGKALDKNVAELGKTVEADFLNDMQQLKTIATRKSINLPASYNETYRKTYQTVAHKHKDQFDKAYVDHVIDGYKDKIDQYKKQASDGKDSSVQRWALERIPLLQRRLHEAEVAATNLK